MRHFDEEFSGMRLLCLDELEMVSGGDGEDTDDNPDTPPLPPGMRPVGDGTKYMADANGKYHLTPQYQYQLEHSAGINWAGVVRDLAWITGNSLTFGGFGTGAAVAGGLLANGIDAWNSMGRP